MIYPSILLNWVVLVGLFGFAKCGNLFQSYLQLAISWFFLVHCFFWHFSLCSCTRLSLVPMNLKFSSGDR